MTENKENQASKIIHTGNLYYYWASFAGSLVERTSATGEIAALLHCKKDADSAHEARNEAPDVVIFRNAKITSVNKKTYYFRARIPSAIISNWATNEGVSNGGECLNSAGQSIREYAVEEMSDVANTDKLSCMFRNMGDSEHRRLIVDAISYGICNRLKYGKIYNTPVKPKLTNDAAIALVKASDERTKEAQAQVQEQAEMIKALQALIAGQSQSEDIAV